MNHSAMLVLEHEKAAAAVEDALRSARERLADIYVGGVPEDGGKRRAKYATRLDRAQRLVWMLERVAGGLEPGPWHAACWLHDECDGGCEEE